MHLSWIKNSPPIPMDSIAQQVEWRTGIPKAQVQIPHESTFFSWLRQCKIITKNFCSGGELRWKFDICRPEQKPLCVNNIDMYFLEMRELADILNDSWTLVNQVTGSIPAQGSKIVFWGQSSTNVHLSFKISPKLPHFQKIYISRTLSLNSKVLFISF